MRESHMIPLSLGSSMLMSIAKSIRWAWVDTRSVSGSCVDLVISWISPGPRVLD
jgi:hypothetical protein